MGTKQTLEYLDWSGGLVDENFADRGDSDFRSTLQECYNWIHTNAGNLRLRPKLVEFLTAGWQNWTVDDIRVFPIFADDRTKSSFLFFLRDDTDWIVKRVGADGDIDAVGTISTATSIGSISVVQVADTVYVAGAGFIPRKITSANVLSTLTFYEQIPGTWVTAYKIAFTSTFNGVFAEGDILTFKKAGNTSFSGRLLRATVVEKGTVTVQTVLYITDIVGTVTDTFSAVVSVNGDGSATALAAITYELVIYSYEGLGNEYLVGTDTARIGGVNYTVNDSDKFHIRLSSAGGSHPFGPADGITVAAKISISPRPVAVGFYQNRLVYCGDVESALGSLLGVSAHYMRMWYSVVGDPLVIRPAGIGDLAPNGPIELDIFTGQTDRIHGMQCGNTIVVFGEQHEYVQTTRGPIGPAIENLPRFDIAGDNGSSVGSPAISYDGRILFAPAFGGDVLRMGYDADTERYAAESLAAWIQNRMDVPYAIASRPATSADGVKRVFVVTVTGKIFVGTNVAKDRLSWAECGVPVGYLAKTVAVLNGEVFFVIMRADGDINIAYMHFSDTGKYVLDFADGLAVGNATTSWTLGSDWYDKRVFFVGTDSDGVESSIGFLDVGSAGAVTLPFACTSITYGYPPENYFVPARPTGGDEKGSGHLRPMKVMRVNVGVKDTTQLTIDGSPVFPEMGRINGQDLPERAFGAGRKMLVRWVRRPSVTIRSVAPFRATVLSASFEVVT